MGSLVDSILNIIRIAHNGILNRFSSKFNVYFLVDLRGDLEVYKSTVTPIIITHVAMVARSKAFNQLSANIDYSFLSKYKEK